jgi:hypothetical protein
MVRMRKVPPTLRRPHQVCRSIMLLHVVMLVAVTWSEMTLPMAALALVHPSFPPRSTRPLGGPSHRQQQQRQQQRQHHSWVITTLQLVAVATGTSSGSTTGASSVRPLLAATSTTNTNTNNNDDDNDDNDNDNDNEWQQDRLRSLLSYIDNNDPMKVSCGLDASDKERQVVASVIQQVEDDAAHNWATIPKGKITFADLAGEWKLLYTSSRTMCINKSLSGLGRSSSDMAQFSSLVQKLGGTK